MALGKTLTELRREPLEDYALWRAYELSHAFPCQRSEAGVALAGAAVCQSFGGKVKPQDLLPDFHPPKILDYAAGAALFAAFATNNTRS